VDVVKRNSQLPLWVLIQLEVLKKDNSGYQGTWTSTEDMGTFNNGYYQSMLLKGWGPDIAVNGNADKNQWKRVDLTANDLATDN